MIINNWNPSNIFDVRDKFVETRMGKLVVKLYSDGWSIGKYERMDIWNACRYLNDLEVKYTY